MHLFFQGPSGIGKSSLLRQRLLPYEKSLGGFVVQRLMEEGRQAGFRAVTLEQGYPKIEAIYTRDLSGVFILQRNNKTSVLEEVLAAVEKDVCRSECKLIVLDEIGGIELLSPNFMRRLEHILQGGKPCIGVLKSADNLAHMVSELSLEDSYFQRHCLLEKMILLRGDVITLDQEECSKMDLYIDAFLKKA
jgi:nucleoside-triphosphatase